MLVIFKNNNNNNNYKKDDNFHNRFEKFRSIRIITLNLTREKKNKKK